MRCGVLGMNITIVQRYMYMKSKSGSSLHTWHISKRDNGLSVSKEILLTSRFNRIKAIVCKVLPIP